MYVVLFLITNSCSQKEFHNRW